MADISQITLLNGDVVNLKDSAGREAATTGLAGKVNIAQGIQNRGKILKVGSGGLLELVDEAEGTGDVVGPSSAVDEHVAVFDGTTGKAIKDSGYTIGKSVPSDAAFTDTTYEVKSAAAGGTEESLVTTGEKAVWNSKTDNVGTVTGVAMNGGSAIAPDNNGVVNLGTVLTQHQDISGKADLDQSGKVLSSQLPSYVDDVLEYASMQQFPLTGESGKIYIAVDTNISYRWSGTVYVPIRSDLALGETSSTAYRGDRGKAAYDHASAKGSAFASGLYKVTTNNEGHVTDATAVQKSDITGLGIPGQDTTYDPATQSDAGLMSATDKAKLDGMLSATKSNIDSALQTTSGTSKFYREDGTWAITPGTKPYVVALDTVTNTSGSYTHTTNVSNVNSGMKAIQIEVSNPDAFQDKITITAGDGAITLSCSSVSGTSDVVVTIMQSSSAEQGIPGQITSSEFDILAARIGTLSQLNTTEKGNVVAAVNEVKGIIPSVVNNLTSDSTTAALSAAQGKALNSNKMNNPTNAGTTDQILRKSSDGSSRWDNAATQQEIGSAVTTWLGNNVPTGTTVVVDKSLSIENAAAEAQTVGNEFSDLKSALTFEEYLINAGVYTITKDDLESGSWAYSTKSANATRARSKYLFPVRAGMVIDYNNTTFDTYMGVLATPTSNTYAQSSGWVNGVGTFTLTKDGWMTFIITNHADTSANVNPADYDSAVVISTESRNNVRELKSAFNATNPLVSWNPSISSNAYINTDTGVKVTGSTAKNCCTTSIWNGSWKIIAIKLKSNDYKYRLSFYDSTGSLSTGTGYLGGTEFKQGMSYIPDYAVKFGVTFRKLDDSSLDSSDIDTIKANLIAYAPTDTTLTEEGFAADAKAVGDLAFSTGGIITKWEQGRITTEGGNADSSYYIRTGFIPLKKTDITAQFLTPYGSRVNVYGYTSNNLSSYVSGSYIYKDSSAVSEWSFTITDPTIKYIRIGYRRSPLNTIEITPENASEIGIVYTKSMLNAYALKTECLLIQKFETASAMRSSNCLYSGMVCETLGYYDPWDGGGARYRIREKTTGETEDQGLRHFVTLGDGTDGVAEMIVNDRINVLSIGCKKGDSSFNNGSILNSFLAGNTNILYPIYFPKGTYYVSSGINVNYKVDFVGDYMNYTAAARPLSASDAGSRIRTPNNICVFYLHTSDVTFTNLIFTSTLSMSHSVTDLNVKNHTVFSWSDDNSETKISNRAIYASPVEASAEESKFRFTCTNCAFYGFDVAVTTCALAVFNACTFFSCRTGVRIAGHSIYFYNCSFSNHDYAIETNGHAINIYGCWFDMIKEHAITGTPSNNGGMVYGYINGTFDCINKSAIYAKSSFYGLIIDAKIMKTGLYWAENKDDLETALENASTDLEKFDILSGASAISIYDAGAVTMNVVNAKAPWDTDAPTDNLIPLYFYNGKKIRNAIISGVFRDVGVDAIDDDPTIEKIIVMSPLVDTGDSYCMVNDGMSSYQIHTES